MDLGSFHTLLTSLGQEALEAAQRLDPQEKDFLHHFQFLSRHYPPELAKAALEIAILRKQAVGKFPQAAQLYFTREALEQASSSIISSYRAKRYQGYSRVLDLGCSIGSDSIALAAVTQVVGLDNDYLRLSMAKENLQTLGYQDRADFLLADLNHSLPVNPHAEYALFFDPARRFAGKRIFSVADYQPQLSVIKSWLPKCQSIGIKISPGVKLEELREYDAEVEFISIAGDLKEAVLWFGPLKSTHRRATLLPGKHTMIEDISDQAQDEKSRSSFPITPPKEYFYEPDPAVIRSGLVRNLGFQLDAAQVDPDIAYLTSDQLFQSPFASVWRVESWFPFNLKHLRAYLRERRVGSVIIKKRGSPIQPEALERDLRLKGENERVIFLTHWVGKPIVVVCLPQ